MDIPYSSRILTLMYAYFNGEIVPHTQVCISPDDRGFLLADGVYEVIHVYQGQLFQAAEHFVRLQKSLDGIRITGIDLDALERAANALVRRNALLTGEAKIYVQITRGVAPRQHAFPTAPPTPTIYMTATPFTPPTAQWEHGIRVALIPDNRWTRCDIKSIALLPNVLANQEAHERGADEAVFVRDGYVTEGSHTGICAIISGALTAHPLTSAVLPSITRDNVLRLGSEIGLPVVERPIPVEEFLHASEILALGTTSGLLPVIQVDAHLIGDGIPGPYTRQIQTAYQTLTARACPGIR